MTIVTLYWQMSFSDPDRPAGSRWLGGTVVQAATVRAAIARAHLLGINPGGEVQAVPFEADSVDTGFLEHLVTDRDEYADMPEPVGLRAPSEPPDHSR